MKYTREIKVGLLAIIVLAVAYWGFNFLKGVNLFAPTKTYYGIWQKANGLTEQAPVYIKGYKVGQVDKILYDFTKEEPFTVAFSIDKQIILPEGTQVSLIQDGLMGGGALEVLIPNGNDVTCYANKEPYYNHHDTLPTTITNGLIDNLQNTLLASISNTINHLDSVILTVQDQLDGNHVKTLLTNVEQISADLTVSATKLKTLMKVQVPNVINQLDSTIYDIHSISNNLAQTDLAATINELDSVIGNLKLLTEQINSTDGTLGLLLNDKDVYNNLNQAVSSADSLLTDIKANPKRYINISVFGKSK